MSKTSMHILLFSSLFWFGCFGTSSPTRTYVLSRTSLPAQESSLRIIIGRISLPEYLKRWEMVTMKNEREVRINDFAQWGQLLEDTVKRTLTDNFRQLLGESRVIPGYATAQPGDWKLDLDFLAFTGNEEGFFRVKAYCKASSGKQKKFFTIAFDLPCAVGKPEELVKAHEQALGRLAQETVSKLLEPGERKNPLSVTEQTKTGL